MEFQPFQAIWIDDVPTDDLISLSGESGNHIFVFRITFSAQPCIVEERQAISVPEGADGMALSGWSHHRRDEHGMGIRVPEAEQFSGQYGEAVAVILFLSPDHLGIADGVIEVPQPVPGPGHLLEASLDILEGLDRW